MQLDSVLVKVILRLKGVLSLSLSLLTFVAHFSVNDAMVVRYYKMTSFGH